MNRSSLPGTRITQGPSDWQVLQRRLDNAADVPLAGVWLAPDVQMAEVEIRLVDETWQRPAAPHLDWQAADTSPDRTWRHVLEGISAGGPNRSISVQRSAPQSIAHMAITKQICR